MGFLDGTAIQALSRASSHYSPSHQSRHTSETPGELVRQLTETASNEEKCKQRLCVNKLLRTDNYIFFFKHKDLISKFNHFIEKKMV